MVNELAFQKAIAELSPVDDEFNQWFMEEGAIRHFVATYEAAKQQPVVEECRKIDEMVLSKAFATYDPSLRTSIGEAPMVPEGQVDCYIKQQPVVDVITIHAATKAFCAALAFFNAGGKKDYEGAGHVLIDAIRPYLAGNTREAQPEGEA